VCGNDLQFPTHNAKAWCIDHGEGGKGMQGQVTLAFKLSHDFLFYLNLKRNYYKN
jgi:hypothetical protein